MHTEALRKTLEYLSDLLGVSIKYEWISKEPSNINLYLFAGQIALAVLTGTAISFISFMLNKKVYAFTIKELLMYKYRWYNNNFSELVIMNFLLLFLNIPLLYIFYSELLCMMLFILSLIITYKIIKVISNVFLMTNIY